MNNRKDVIVLDIETNTAHDTIWMCGLMVNYGTPQYVTTPQELQTILSTAKAVVGHNIIGFDKPILESCWKIDFSGIDIVDTLVMSRLLEPDMEGGHSLKAWGKRIVVNKMEFDTEDFDGGLTDEMIEYCLRDVDVTYHLYHVLLRKLEDFSSYSIDLEHDVATITAQQIKNGFKLDISVASNWHTEMCERLAEISEELQAIFPPIVTIRWSEKTGKRLKDNIEIFNVASRQQIAKRLETLGVVWKEFTETGQAVINEKTLDIPVPEAQLCKEYLQLVKLKGMADSWLTSVDKATDRIHGYVNPCGAVTGRMTHSRPNLAQIPSLPIARQCFTVDMGNVLVGCDASGLELRMLAHYMNDDAYTQEILHGDIHTANQNAAGLSERNQAKTFIYAFLYGAGDAKIGSIVGGTASDGKQLKEKFLRNTPTLSKLRENVSRNARTGYLTGLDGRKVHVRSEHAALNTLLQSAGAIVMKVAIKLCVQKLKANGIPFKLVAQVHDEFQFEAPQHFGKAVGMIARQSIIDAGIELGLNCPLDGEYRIGTNWSQTH